MENNKKNVKDNKLYKTIDSSFKHFISKFYPIRKEIVRGNALTIREKEYLARAIYGSLLGEIKPRYATKVPGLFSALTSNESWNKLRSIVNNNEVLAGYATYFLLKSINESLNDPNSVISKVLKMIMKEIEKLFGRKINEIIALKILNSGEHDKIFGIDGIIFNNKLKELNNFKHKTIHKAMQEIKNLMNAFILNLLNKLKELSEAIALISMLIPGRYWDLSPGFIKSIYFQNLILLAKIMNNIENLRKLVKILGRIELIMRKEKKLAPAVANEIYEVRISGDIERVIPSELVKLKHKKLKLLFYAKMIEKGLLTYYLRGKVPFEKSEKEKRGPIIIAIDTSGSMHGEPELLAKAIALAVIQLAAKHKRKVYLILFSGPGNLEELEFTKGKTSLESLLKFLSLSFGGGTDFNTPIRRVIELLKEDKYNKADALFLTDGLSDINSYTLNKLNEVKAKSKARIFTIIVGNDNLAGAEKFSDEGFYVTYDDFHHIPKLVNLTKNIKVA